MPYQGHPRWNSGKYRRHATVDLRKRYSRQTTVCYDYGVLRSEETTEQFDLTYAEIAAIDAGETTRAQVLQAILDASCQNDGGTE